jgi:hypothetical protein
MQLPLALQYVVFVLGSMQVPLQRTLGAVQVHTPATHVASVPSVVQSIPGLAQDVVAPQWVVLVLELTQAPLQSTSGETQVVAA